MKLVLFSDLHLDAPFGSLCGNLQADCARRHAVRDSLRRTAALFRKVELASANADQHEAEGVA